MEQLEVLIDKQESSFMAKITGILSQPCSNRVKVALIYQHYIDCQVAINILVSEAKLKTPPAGEASGN